MSSLSPSSPEFFEAKYQRDADPWNFESSDYERRRYDAIVQIVAGSRYSYALEPGCSVGVLTEALAPLCDRLLAFDFSPTAVSKARQRCQRFPHVRVRCLSLEAIESFAEFDLIVLSEIGYYFPEPRWKDLVAKIAAEMPPGATLVAAHWTGHSEDHQTSGDSVHRVLRSNSGLCLQQSQRHAGFLLDRWARP